MAKQIRYSEEFKRQAVSAYLQGELSCYQISQEIHVHPKTLSAWIRQFKNGLVIATELPSKDMRMELKLPTNRDVDTIFSTLTEIEAQVEVLKKLILDYQ